MSIAAAYLVSEGVVLGADSSTAISVQTPQGTGVVQLLTHSQKVFEVGENSRLGICTWGAGSVGNTSHRTIVAQLAEKVNDATKIQKAAEELCNIAVPLAKESNVEFVGYYLGGWDPVKHDPTCFKIEIRRGETKIDPLNLGLCSFSGMPFFFTRVFWGYDPRLRDGLRNNLKRSLSIIKDDKDFDAIFDKAFEEATAPLIAAGFKDLPIREAIDFVYSYLHITVKAMKFQFGPPVCGGPIEIGFVTTDRRFRWVRHKTFESAILEQEGRYYDR